MNKCTRWGRWQSLNKKAFTLIELLAVIVILAIIALIATPIILGIINDSKKQSNERSAELYLKAAELAIARENLNGELNASSCDVITNETKSNFEGSEEGDLNCGGKLVKVEMDGEKPKSGKLTFSNGKIATISNLNVSGKYINKTSASSEMVISDTPNEEETEVFSGTIYRNSTKTIKIGDSIVPKPTGKWCGEISGIGNSCDLEVVFDSESECITFLADQGLSGTCDPEIGGLTPGSYYIEDTKSNITTNAYLMHVVKDDIVQESYACLRYSQDEEPACVKGADPNAYGEFDGISESSSDVSDKNPTKNIAELAKTSSYLSNCFFSAFNSYCSDSSLYFGARTDGEVDANDDSVSCSVYSNGTAACNSKS